MLLDAVKGEPEVLDEGTAAPERFSEDEDALEVGVVGTVLEFEAVTGDADVLDTLPELNGAVYEYGAGMYGTGAYGTGV